MQSRSLISSSSSRTAKLGVGKQEKDQVSIPECKESETRDEPAVEEKPLGIWSDLKGFTNFQEHLQLDVFPQHPDSFQLFEPSSKQWSFTNLVICFVLARTNEIGHNH